MREVVNFILKIVGRNTAPGDTRKRRMRMRKKRGRRRRRRKMRRRDERGKRRRGRRGKDLRRKRAAGMNAASIAGKKKKKREVGRNIMIVDLSVDMIGAGDTLKLATGLLSARFLFTDTYYLPYFNLSLGFKVF